MATKVVDSPIGPLGLVASDQGLRAVLFGGGGLRTEGQSPVLGETATQLEAYFGGDLVAFDVPPRAARVGVPAQLLARACIDPLWTNRELRRAGAPARTRPGSRASRGGGKRTESATARAAVSSRDRCGRLTDRLRRRPGDEALSARARRRDSAARLISSVVLPTGLRATLQACAACSSSEDSLALDVCLRWLPSAGRGAFTVDDLEAV